MTVFGITAPTLITVSLMRDEPEPAPVGARDHPDVARAAPLAARHALELRVHRDVAQDRIDFALAEALGEEARAPGGVHDGGDPHGCSTPSAPA